MLISQAAPLFSYARTGGCELTNRGNIKEDASDDSEQLPTPSPCARSIHDRQIAIHARTHCSPSL